MTTAAENRLLTQTGPGTPMGGLIRQYWIPAAKSSELVADGDPVRLLLLHEKLVAFRDSSGRVGIMDHRCPHRCASLFFGRNEEDGIRCVYHGWKFDVDGNCLDMANVPPHQDFKHKVKARAYKTAERNGLVWVFMGDQANVPELPPIEATLIPEDQMTIEFIQRECNWLQGLEGDLDTSHLGILHYGGISQAFGEGESNRHALTNRTPEYVTAETETGYMYAAHRPTEKEGEIYWRLAHYLFPFWALPPITPIEQNFLVRGYIPMDDTHTTVLIMIYKNAYPWNRTKVNQRARGAHNDYEFLPNTTDWYGRWRPPVNARNDYLIDRAIQRTESFTGIDGVAMQDQAVTESMEPIADRTREHLAPSDIAINRTRRRIVTAARAYGKDGTLPASARDATLFAGVRSGQFYTTGDADWIKAARDYIDANPLIIEKFRAAE